MIITSFGSELPYGDASGFVRIVPTEKLCGKYPFVRALCVTFHRKADVITCRTVSGSGMPSVHHAAVQLQRTHSGQGSLGMGRPCCDGAQKHCEKKYYPSHGYLIFSSLMIRARTRSSFSTVKD